MARAKKRNTVTTWSLTHLPALAGGAIAAYAGKGLMWGFARVWHKPGGTAVTLLMTAGMGLAATNAMYMQTSRHPAPLFIDASAVTASVTPADPPERRTVIKRKVKIAALPKQSAPIEVKKVVPDPVAVVAPPEVPEVAVDSDGGPLTHDEVLALQEKLKQFGYFKGDVDGFYGPQTADAIRAFETAYGLEPVGALSREAYGQILAAAKVTKSAITAEPVVPAEPIAAEPEAVEQPVKKTAAIPEKITEPETSTTQSLPVRLQGDPLTIIASKVATTARKAILESRPSEDEKTVEKIQRGLASLGFLQGRIDGVAGEATAKAIRNFEVYYNYDVTGAATPELLDLLKKAGAE